MAKHTAMVVLIFILFGYIAYSMEKNHNILNEPKINNILNEPKRMRANSQRDLTYITFKNLQGIWYLTIMEEKTENKIPIPGFIFVEDDLVKGPALKFFENNLELWQVEDKWTYFTCGNKMKILKKQDFFMDGILIWYSSDHNGERYIWSRVENLEITFTDLQGKWYITGMDVDKFKYQIPGYVEVKEDIITGPALENFFGIDFLQIEENTHEFICMGRLKLLKTEKSIIWSSLCDNEKYIWSQTPNSLPFEENAANQDDMKITESESQQEEDEDDEEDEEEEDDDEDEEEEDDEEDEEEEDDDDKTKMKDEKHQQSNFEKKNKETISEKDLQQFIQDFKLNFTVKELQEFIKAQSNPENPMSLDDLHDVIDNCLNDDLDTVKETINSEDESSYESSEIEEEIEMPKSNTKDEDHIENKENHENENLNIQTCNEKEFVGDATENFTKKNIAEIENEANEKIFEIEYNQNENYKDDTEFVEGTVENIKNENIVVQIENLEKSRMGYKRESESFNFEDLKIYEKIKDIDLGEDIMMESTFDDGQSTILKVSQYDSYDTTAGWTEDSTDHHHRLSTSSFSQIEQHCLDNSFDSTMQYYRKQFSGSFSATERKNSDFPKNKISKFERHCLDDSCIDPKTGRLQRKY